MTAVKKTPIDQKATANTCPETITRKVAQGKSDSFTE
jgi:hypothetical protein